jgi:glycosyltransferase involved in cell wall biosynthesis
MTPQPARSAAHPRVAHIITGLYTGGAEMMLCKLAASSRERPAWVLSLQGGPHAARIEALGVPVYSIGGGGWRGALRTVARVVRELRRNPPDILQGWMYHGNLAATLLSWVCPGDPRVVWNVRQSFHAYGHEKAPTALLIWLGARMSGTTSAVVYNSAVSAVQHQRIGYDKSKARILPNGFDLEKYAPDPGRGGSQRAAIGIREPAFTLGLIARYHPMKDHANFFAAAVILVQRGFDVECILAGQGVSPDNAELAALAAASGLGRRVHLLGHREDVSAILSALDACTLTSYRGEAFPNVIGEAMACGIPCVVTDVGDCREIVGDTGRVVVTRDPVALADAIEELLREGRAGLAARGARARDRVVTHYSLAAVAEAYAAFYASLYAHDASGAPNPISDHKARLR